MNVLFAVKLITILERLEDNAKWQSQIHYAEHSCTKQFHPKDGMTRVALMAPQLMHIIPNVLSIPEYFRVRLAYTPDFPRVKYIALEIYDVNGKLLQTVPHSDWNTLLSLAIETEMLEILLNINPW